MKISSLHLPDRRLFAGVAIGVLVGALGVGAVTAASSSPAAVSGATGAASASATGAGIPFEALRRAVGRNFRVDVTATNTNGTHTILYVRGVLDVASASVTVTLPDNTTQTFAVDASVVVRDNGHKVPFSDLKDGERAMVFGTRNADGTYTARLIRCVKEA